MGFLRVFRFQRFGGWVLVFSYHGETKGCSFERFCPDKGSSAPVKFLEFIVKQTIVILMIYILMVYSSLEIILSSYISDGSWLPEQSHR